MFEVISHGGGAFIMQVLNGVAMIFGSGDYIYALKICAMLGSIGILIGCAFSGRVPDVKWILITIFIYVFAFLPKVDVTVTDTVERTSGLPTVRVAGNVPIGLAFIASFSSHMGDYITRMMETVFSMPNEINYRNGGLLFAEAITEDALKAKVRDPNLNMSLSNFWHDCVFYDLGLGFYSMTDLAQAENIQQFLSVNTAAGRAFEFINTDGSKSYEMCRTSITTGGKLYAALDAETTKRTAMIAGMNDSSGTSNMNQLISNNASAMPIAFAYLTKMSKTATEILNQSILANSFGDGLVAFANSADAASVMNGYVAAKAEAERNTTFTVLGKISARMLPMLKNIFEGLIYAMAPVIGMMMMFPGAHKVALGYAQALLWITLWGPLFAVFHWASSFYAAMAGDKAAELCGKAAACTGGSFSMYTMHGIIDVMTSSAAIAGYIGVSIPMIAYMLVSRSGAMMASLAGRVMDGYQAPVSKNAAEAAAGNINMGNMSYENVSAFQGVTAPSNTADFVKHDSGRAVSTQTASGNISQVKVDSGPATMNAQASLQSAVSQQQTEATRAKDSASASLTQASVNQYTRQVAAERAVTHGDSVGHGGGIDKKTSDSYTYSNVSNAAHKFGDSRGVTAANMDQAMADMGIGVSVPGLSPVNGGAKLSVTSRNSQEYRDAQSAAKEFVKSDDFRHALNTSKDAYMRDTSGRTDEASVSGRSSVTNAASKTSTAQKNYTEAVEHETAVARVAQDIRTNSATIGADLSGYLRSKVEEGGESWEAFNVKVSSGDPGAMGRLKQYSDEYAQDYVGKAVTMTQAAVERAGEHDVKALEGKADRAVDAARGDGSSVVEGIRDKENTQDRDAGAIRQRERAAEGAVKAVMANQGSAAVSQGDGLERDVGGVIHRGSADVEGKVDVRGEKTVVGAVVDKTAKDAVEVANDAVETGKGLWNKGAQAVEDGAAAIGIDLNKVDKFLGLDKSDEGMRKK